jgi:hypothetical protein
MKFVCITISLVLLIQAQARPVGLSVNWTEVEGAEETAGSLVASGTFIAKNAFLQGPVTLSVGDSLSVSLTIASGTAKPKFDEDGVFIGFGNASSGGYMVAEFDTGPAGADPLRHRSRNSSTNLAGTIDLAVAPLDEPAIDPGIGNHLDADNAVSIRIAITRSAKGYVFATRWGNGAYISNLLDESWAPGENALDTLFFRSRQSADWQVTNVAVDYQSSETLDPDLVIGSIPLPGNLGLQPEPLSLSAVIENGGTTEVLRIESVVFQGDAVDHFSASEFTATLEPGLTGTIGVAFDPKGKTGLFEASLVITTNTADSPVVVPLSTFVPLITGFRATPAVVNLGESSALSWVTDPRAAISMTPEIGDLDAASVDGAGSLSSTPAGDTNYLLSASLGEEVQDRTVSVTTLQVVPRGYVELEEDWSFDDGSGEGSASSLTASGTFRARLPFQVGQIALAMGDFVSVRMVVNHGETKPVNDDDDGVFVGFGNRTAGGYVLSELDTGVVGLTPVRHRYRNDSTNLMSTVDLVAAEISNADIDPGEAQHLTGENSVEFKIVLGRTEQGYQMETDWGGTVYTSVIPEATWSPGNHSIDTFFFRARQGADWELSEIAVAFNLAGQDPDLKVPNELVDNLHGVGPHNIAIPITNGGKVNALEITSAQVVGPDRDLFMVGGLPGSIPVDGTGEITVQFAPGERLGGFAAILELESNDSGDPVSHLDLSTFLGTAGGGLLAHYPFDEYSATVVYDHSGQGYHGRYVAENDASATVLQPALASGSSISLVPGEADAAFVEVPKNVGLPTLTEFSVALWFQPDPAATGVSVLFSKGDALGDPFSLAYTGSSLLWVGNGQQSAPFADVVTGEAQHLVVVVAELNATLYLDGILVGSVDFENFDDTALSAFRIGALNGVFGFHGVLDDLQIYQSVLSSEEVQFLHANPGQVLVGEAEPPTATVFEIVAIQRTHDGVTLTVSENAAENYEIEYSETLAPETWQVIGNWTALEAPFVDRNANRNRKPSGYYRVKR